MNTRIGRAASRAFALASAAVMAASLSVGSAAADAKVEVMHWWTSGGEANALSVLKDALQKDGIQWMDAAVAGGSGTNALQVLQARVAAGNPPAAMQMHGQQIKSYAAEGMLGDLSEIAKAENWDAVMSPDLQAYAKYDGHYVGVPMNMHRHNWMWASRKILDRYGGKMPETWDEWFAIADKMKADGVLPLAHGGQPWQEFFLWEDIALGLYGKDFHRAALEKQDMAALQSDKMVKVFETFRKVIGYADPNNADRDWNLATALVIEDKAAFQFMGDWAKGEFAVANKKPNEDYLCASVPGTKGVFVYLADFWGFFPVNGADDKKAQAEMAKLSMDPKVQVEFNLRKGSIPSRIDISGDAFDACGKQAIADRQDAMKTDSMLPSLAQNHAASREIRGVYEDVITAFAHTPAMTPQEAIKRLVDGLKAL